MKIEFLDESNFTSKNLRSHQKHFDDYRYDVRFKDIDFNDLDAVGRKYDEIGDQLSWRKCGKSDSDNRYVGFIDHKGRKCKYDRVNNDFIKYKGEESITLFKITPKRYDIIRKRDFASELSPTD